MKLRRFIRVIRVSRGLILLIAAEMFTTFYVATPALAQCTFSSGSTGTNGDFNPPTCMPTNSGWSVSNNVITVTNTADGIFNFKSVYIETNWVVKFTKNTLNTPVYLLASSNVTIKGTIDVSGGNGSTNVTGSGVGGPGGFDGGYGAPGTDIAGDGFGPGGGRSEGHGQGAGFGTAGNDYNQGWYRGGYTYGTLDIQPFIGGSGGSAGYWKNGGAGGGGGAILIASSGTIDVPGRVLANAGTTTAFSGDGSGGAIRLVAQTIQGEGTITAYDIVPGGQFGGVGRIRIEACAIKRQTLTLPPATFGLPGAVFLATNPTIRVTSIEGVNVLSPPAGSLSNPDTNLPSGFANPAHISVSASNIDVGTTFKVIVAPVWGSNLVAQGTLSTGNYISSTGSLTMNVYTDRVWRVNALIPYISRP